MSCSTGQPGPSLVVADRERTYYLIPVETFERCRVPAERKSELESALREHDSSGYLGLLAIGALLAGAAVVGALAADEVFDRALPNGVQGCFERPTPGTNGIPATF